MNNENKNLDSDVIIAHLKLSRAMRRCPPPASSHPFPPAVGRLLECAAANPGVSSRELCEALDLRPSSLSEILARAENDGFLSRTVDESDRRVQRVSLTDKGRAVVAEIENAHNEDAKKKTSCLSEEEKVLFCSLCSRLSEHIEKLALDLPEGMMPPPPFPEGPGPEKPGPDHDKPGKPCRPPLPPGGRYRC
jgi:DNA-binding MarR family transcriptional regulator